MAFDEQNAAGERTEQPTAKRREDARRKGQLAKSPDLTGAALLLSALAVYWLMGGRAAGSALEVIRHGIAGAGATELTTGSAGALFVATSGAIVLLAWPFIVIPAAAAVGVQLLQTRGAVSWEALAPQWGRVNPAQGLGRLMGATGLAEAAKTIVKLLILAVVAYLTLKAGWPALLGVGRGAAALGDTGAVIRDLWLRVGVAYLVLAALDYGHKWWVHQRQLRMTRAEVQEEQKELEGNPLLKSRIRALHRQRAVRRMMAEAQKADVVVRNPVHFAVALKYDSGRMRAPRVVAKGARLMARRIVETALRHGVPVVENPPLARSLFKQVRIGQEIPAELYRLVAEVLARVYALREGGR